MTEDTISTEQPVADAPKPIVAAKKPAFKRVSPAKLAEEKTPAFKRAKAEPVSDPVASEVKTFIPAVIVQEPAPQPKANIQEILSMIEIHKYVEAIANGTYNVVDKSKMKDLQSIKLLLDNKIVSMLLSEDFKKAINFQDADKVALAARKANTLTDHPLRSQLYG